MPVLGYGQVSSIAPDTISAGWKGIVQTLRQTGQEIAANVEKIQTNKQLQAFTQEASSLSPQSPDYMPQLIGLAGKYPLVGASPQGRMALGMAEMANKNFLAQQMDERNFGQQKELLGLTHQNRMTELGARTGPGAIKQDRFGRWVDTRTGDVVQDPIEQPIKVPEGTALVGPDGEIIREASPRTTATPFRMGGGFMGNAATGEVLPLPMTPFQEAQLGAKEEALGVNRAKLQMQQLQGDTNALIQEQKLEVDPARKADIQRRIDRNRSELDTLNRISVPTPLGGSGMPQIAVDPAVVPTLQALPQPQTAKQASPIQPAPQFVPGKVYRDKAGNRRVFTGDSWQPAP